MYEHGLVLNNPQELICCKTQPTDNQFSLGILFIYSFKAKTLLEDQD